MLEPGHSFTKAICPGHPKFEPDLRALLKRRLRPGDTFIDCGTNIGFFSVLANRWVGPTGTVISIEANPLTVPLLRRNLESNGFPVNHIVHAALTKSPGELELHMPEIGDTYSSIKVGGLVTGANVRKFRVTGRTLDSVVQEFAPSRVDFIKIDVEGADLEVLQSASGTVDRFRPLISIEYGVVTWKPFGATQADLERFCREHRYEIGLYDIDSDRLSPPTPTAWESEYVNFFLTPNS